MSYSVQLYTVRTQLEQDLPGTLTRLAEIGFTRVEPYDFVGRVDDLAESLAANELTAPSGHAPLLDADQDEIFSAARKLGIGTVIEPYVGREHWQTKHDIEQTAARLNAAAVKSAEYGIRVGYHNHVWELEASVGEQTALEFFAGQLNPELVLEVDTYWASIGGQNPADLLARLGNRVRFIHIKDGPMSADTLTQLPAGAGSVPIWDVIAAARSLEVGVVEFDDYAGDIFEGVARSLAYLQAGPVTV